MCNCMPCSVWYFSFVCMTVCARARSHWAHKQHKQCACYAHATGHRLDSPHARCEPFWRKKKTSNSQINNSVIFLITHNRSVDHTSHAYKLCTGFMHITFLDAKCHRYIVFYPVINFFAVCGWKVCFLNIQRTSYVIYASDEFCCCVAICQKLLLSQRLLFISPITFHEL